MGCDIHIVLERRTADGWLGVDSFRSFEMYGRKEGDFNYAYPPARDRNYGRFAKLAGVRGDGPEPRGMPEDASALARHMANEWGLDGHSHSWLPLAEALAVWTATQYWPDWERLDSYKRQYPAAFFFGVEDSDDIAAYRLVFWFDN